MGYKYVEYRGKFERGHDVYNIGICDDGEHICSAIENMVLDYGREKGVNIEVQVWYTGEGLCKYLKEENFLDILFLDIELFELNGIQVGQFIRNELEDRQMQIVYISGEASYAHRLFKTQPMDFLVKPVTREDVNEVLDLAFKILGDNNDKFEFQCGKDYYFIPYGEIIYFVSEGRKIKIVTQYGEKEFYGKLKDIISDLPKNFIMIHQSFVINQKHVLRYTYETVELLGESY